MIRSRTLAQILLAGALAAVPAGQSPEDPELRAAVERFFAAQEAEDVEAYLALWSTSVRSPVEQARLVQQLGFIFASGDDSFSNIVIRSVTPAHDRIRVRVSVTRERLPATRIPGAPPVPVRSDMLVSLTYVREDGEWKLVREAPASQDLAFALVEAESADERARLLDADSELVTARLVEDLSRIASQAAQTSKHAASQAGFERMLEVARRIGHRKYEGEALQHIGNARFFQGQLPAALDAYEQRLAIEREREDDEAVAAALGGVATVRYALAEYGAAFETYREALAIHQRLGDQAGMATALISTGHIQYLQGEFDAAIADYTRSRELYRKVLRPDGEAQALEGLGRVFMVRGDYAGALEAFTGVLEEARARNDRTAQGNATLNIGEVHFRLGNLETARSTFEQSREHFEAVKDVANVGRVWQAIALMDLAAGRFAIAEQEYVRSSAICGAAADADCVAGAAGGLAFAQSAQEKFSEAVVSYRKAADAFTALDRREHAARAEVGLSQALSGSGDYKQAVEAAARARGAAVGLANDDVLWRALVAQARALRGLGESEDALGAARTAVSAVDRLVEVATVRPATPAPRDSGAVFATLAVLEAERGDAAAAFESVERMRTHDLRVTLATSEREITRGMTEAEREEERMLAGELISLHAQRSREQSLPRPDAARLDRLDHRIAEATARQMAWQQRLFERLPELRLWRGLLEPATREEIATLLPEAGTVLLELVADDRNLVVVSARRVEEEVTFAAAVSPVSRQSLADRVAKLTQAETLRSLEEWRHAASELLEAIPPGMLSLLAGAERAIVVPHEMLWRVPFEALPVGDRLLGDRTTVTVASSASALVRLPDVARGMRREATVLLAGAPAIGDASLARLRQTSPSWAVRPIENAARELELIAAGLDPDLTVAVTGAELTEPALREQLPAGDVLHLAAPFRINGASVLFSPMLLGSGRTEDSAGPGAVDSLDVREIVNLELRARVAVISDGTAMSMRDASDEAGAVQWAWRAAGVPALILSRWTTDERASNELLRELHRRLAAGETPAAALRGARTKVRQTDGWAAPFYWAGWLLIGGP